MSNIQLTSRDEELLKAILGEGIVDFKPQSRIEALLKRILDEGAMGGDSVRIKGYYDTVAELEAAHPTGSAGDAYLVGSPSHIYTWLVDDAQWHDGGAFTAVPGPDGNGIVSIEKTATVGLVDTYTVTYTDGDTDTFNVTNGANGNGIVSIEKTATVGLVDTYTITLTDGSTYTFTVTNGVNGTDGTDGTDGNGIISVTKTSSEGLVDTYTILFDNGSSTTFEITNGKDGTDGDPGADGISVLGVSINASNHLIVTLSNGTTVDAGVVPHNNGYPIPE
jgi:hypothetical protein